MRSKENDNDYRYFPDPDLLPIKIGSNELAEIRQILIKFYSIQNGLSLIILIKC